MLTEAEAMVAVYHAAERSGLKASGPKVHRIEDRNDAVVCWALLEGEGQPLIAALFLVYRIRSEIKVDEMFRWRGLRLLKVFERGEYFMLKIAGPGLQSQGLRVSLADKGLVAKNKTGAMYN